MNKEQIEIKIIKSQIETEKIALDRYVKAIVRSVFKECCTGGAYFNKLFYELIQRGNEELIDSKINPELKKKLRDEWFMRAMFGKPGQSELEIWKSNLAYQKRLTNWAIHHLTKLDDDKKEEIVRDCIRQQELWSSQFDRNSQLYKALKDNKVKKRKPKIKISGSYKKKRRK